MSETIESTVEFINQFVRKCVAMKERVDLIEDRLAAIERAATCGTGPNEPVSFSPAQADVGEASAVSKWPRYVGPPQCSVSGAWANGCILIRFDSASSKGVEIFPSKADKAWYGDWTAMENRRIGMGWKDVPRAEAEARIAAAKGEKPQTVVEWAESIGVPFPADTDSHGCPVPPRSAPDDQPPFHVGQVVECVDAGDDTLLTLGRQYTVSMVEDDGSFLGFDELGDAGPEWRASRFRPIPATVEQGPTEGMRRAAVEICGHANHPSVAAIRSLLSTHIGPELAAKLAEAERQLSAAREAAEASDLQLRRLVDALQPFIKAGWAFRNSVNAAVVEPIRSSDVYDLRAVLNAATAAILAAKAAGSTPTTVKGE